MNAISTVFHRLIFAATCLLGWVVFPMFIAAGAAALLCYALIAELFSSMADEVYDTSDDTVDGSFNDAFGDSLGQAPSRTLYRAIHP